MTDDLYDPAGKGGLTQISLGSCLKGGRCVQKLDLIRIIDYWGPSIITIHRIRMVFGSIFIGGRVHRWMDEPASTADPRISCRGESSSPRANRPRVLRQNPIHKITLIHPSDGGTVICSC
jgi:hypothetical protein